MAEEDKIDQFLIARGGPFYALQRQLGLLREDAFRASSRALLFVGLSWGVPLVLSLVSGNAFGTPTEKPYILSLVPWTRFFIATGLFMLMERQVEEQLRKYLVQFTRAPILAPESFDAAAEAVTKALKRRDSSFAESVCLSIAILVTIILFFRVINGETSSWALRVLPDGNSLTIAGWWCVVVSNPIFLFLLLRWLWRIFLWSMLLRDLASLELRLVATHPDGSGGLAFIGKYPNAYTMFVFAVSCVLGSAIVQGLQAGDLNTTTYSFVMFCWLMIVTMLFAYPLLAFRKPLTELKERTFLTFSALATQHYRATERELIGRNISAPEDSEMIEAQEIPDPSKILAAAQKLSVFLVNRSALLPLSTAALLPLVAAGATQLPIKDLFKVMKRLLLL